MQLIFFLHTYLNYRLDRSPLTASAIWVPVCMSLYDITWENPNRDSGVSRCQTLAWTMGPLFSTKHHILMTVLSIPPPPPRLCVSDVFWCPERGAIEQRVETDVLALFEPVPQRALTIQSEASTIWASTHSLTRFSAESVYMSVYTAGIWKCI